MMYADEASAHFRNKYVALLHGLTGVFARTLDAKDPTAPAARADMVVQAQSLGYRFVLQFSIDAREALDDAVSRAIRDSGFEVSAEMVAEMDEYAASVADELTMKMYGVVAANVSTITREQRAIALQTSLLTTRGMTRFGALIQTRLGRVAELDYRIADRAGRKWASRDYVTNMVRHALLQAYVEAYVYILGKNGADTAMVVYDDPEHDRHGMVFSITGQTEEFPSYESIKDKIWHPNSTASVTRTEYADSKS